MATAANSVVLVSALLLLSSCSRQKTISSDQLRSNLTSAASFAAETETFIDYVLKNRATREYARGHIEYLANEVNRSAKELHQASPDATTRQGLQTCQAQLDLLATELTAVRSGIENPEILAAAKARITRIRRVIEQAKASL